MGQRRLFRPLSIIYLFAALLLALPIATARPASASTLPPRLNAFYWAIAHAGDSYCWGGTGPSCFDCSGLVNAAYAHVGIHFGRTTYDMLASGQLIRETTLSQVRKGDLAFYGSGHVELYARGNLTFGALNSGTLLGWHAWNAFWHPTLFFRVRGAG